MLRDPPLAQSSGSLAGGSRLPSQRLERKAAGVNLKSDPEFEVQAEWAWRWRRRRRCANCIAKALNTVTRVSSLRYRSSVSRKVRWSHRTFQSCRSRAVVGKGRVVIHHHAEIQPRTTRTGARYFSITSWSWSCSLVIRYHQGLINGDQRLLHSVQQHHKAAKHCIQGLQLWLVKGTIAPPWQEEK